MFDVFLARIERGELDQGEATEARVTQFAHEVIAASEEGLLTAREAAILWLHHLRRLGIPVHIPHTREGA